MATRPIETWGRQCRPGRDGLAHVRRAPVFIRAKAGQDVPFFVYCNHSLLHMPVILREDFKGLRTPCIVRWPGHIPGGQVSDDIMHVTDWLTTLVRVAGAEEPADRVIDGADQLAWLSGQRSSSLRDGYLYWIGPEL